MTRREIVPRDPLAPPHDTMKDILRIKDERISKLEEENAALARALQAYHKTLYRLWQIAIGEKSKPNKLRKKYPKGDSDPDDDAAYDLKEELKAEGINIWDFLPSIDELDEIVNRGKP